MRIGSVVLLLGLLVSPAEAAAESLVDLYAGWSLTDGSDVELSTSLGEEEISLDHEGSFVVGGRGGYWWRWFGFNFDISYSQPDFEDFTSLGVDFAADLDVVSFGLFGMVRGHLAGERLQPYAYLGPMLFVSSVDVEAESLGIRDEDSDTDATVGVGAGAGLTYMISKKLGVFAEYRFTHHESEFDLESDVLSVELEASVPLTTHHILAGVSFRF